MHCTLQNFWNAIHTPIQYNFWSAIRGSLQQYFWSAIHTPLHIPIQNFVLEKTLYLKQEYDDKIRDPNQHCNNQYGDEFILQGWEVVVIAMNAVVTVRICPKKVQQTGLLFCTPSFPSTPHSPMWIALQSSTPN